MLDAAAAEEREAAPLSGRGELEAVSFNITSPSSSDADEEEEGAGVRAVQEGPRSVGVFGHRLINPYEFIEPDVDDDDERSGRQIQVRGFVMWNNDF